MNEEEIKQKFMELQMFGQQIEQLQQHLKNIDERKQELSELQSNIKEMKEIKQGQEIIFPVSNGIFAKGKLENHELIVNAGADICVTKTIDEAIEMLDERKIELEEASREFLTEFEKLTAQAEGLELNLNSELEKLKK